MIWLKMSMPIIRMISWSVISWFSLFIIAMVFYNQSNDTVTVNLLSRQVKTLYGFWMWYQRQLEGSHVILIGCIVDVRMQGFILILKFCLVYSFMHYLKFCLVYSICTVLFWFCSLTSSPCTMHPYILVLRVNYYKENLTVFKAD